MLSHDSVPRQAVLVTCTQAAALELADGAMGLYWSPGRSTILQIMRGVAAPSATMAPEPHVATVYVPIAPELADLSPDDIADRVRVALGGLTEQFRMTVLAPTMQRVAARLRGYWRAPAMTGDDPREYATGATLRDNED